MDELAFIDYLKQHLATNTLGHRIKTGIGDDMAVLDLAGRTVLFASDMLVEGVHFDLDRASPEQIGHKALAVCLSDCAAMAAKPLAVVVSFAKPKHVSTEVMQRIYDGLLATSKRFACPIVGGDSCSGGDRLTIDVAMLAEGDGIDPVLRGGARSGDTLYLTGALGGSVLGRHLQFEPRIEQARRLAELLPLHAMIDVSDGLSTDLWHLCNASRCGAVLSTEQLETIVSDDARRLAEHSGRTPLEHALNDGEDFELLAAIGLTPDALPELPADLSLLPIGCIVEEHRVTITDPTGHTHDLSPSGYKHF